MSALLYQLKELNSNLKVDLEKRENLHLFKRSYVGSLLGTLTALVLWNIFLLIFS